MADLIYNVLPIPLRDIVFVSPDSTVTSCIDLMTDRDIGALVVLDDNKKLIGIVSERDIVRSCLHKCLDLNTAKAADVVFTKVTLLSPHDHVEKAMQAITQTKRRHVLIEDKGELITILSIGDLLNHLLEDKSRVIEHLENYIHN